MANHEDEQLGRQFQLELRRSEIKQGSLAKAIGKTPSQMSRLANGKDPWTLDIARRVDAVLKSDLAGIVAKRQAPVELYVAAPITALPPDQIRGANLEISRLVAALDRHVDSLHWPGREIHGESDLTDPDLATEANMAALTSAEAFLYIQMHDVVGPSSALIELGIALGRRIHTTIIVKKGVNLPFMLQMNFEGVASRINQFPDPRVRPVDSVEKAENLLRRDGRKLLGLPERPLPRNPGMEPLLPV